MPSPIPPTSPILSIVSAPPATLDSLTADVDGLRTDVQTCLSEIRTLHAALLGDGGVLQRTAAIEKRQWPKMVISHATVIALAGALAEIVRAHYPSFGDALQQIVKALGAG